MTAHQSVCQSICLLSASQSVCQVGNRSVALVASLSESHLVCWLISKPGSQAPSQLVCHSQSVNLPVTQMAVHQSVSVIVYQPASQ